MKFNAALISEILSQINCKKLDVIDAILWMLVVNFKYCAKKCSMLNNGVIEIGLK
jgi:hypothetical protein